MNRSEADSNSVGAAVRACRGVGRDNLDIQVVSELFLEDRNCLLHDFGCIRVAYKDLVLCGVVAELEDLAYDCFDCFKL